jgi:hypothetical protein
MSSDDRFKDPDPLNLRPDDPLVRWRRDVAQQEEERRAAKREQRREEERISVTELRAEISEKLALIDQYRAEMRTEIADLRGELLRERELWLSATGQALGETGNRACDLFETAIKKLEREVFSELAKKFGECAGRIDSIAQIATSRAKQFRFAGEPDDDDVDLPNWRRTN